MCLYVVVVHSMSWFSHGLLPLWLNRAYWDLTRDLCSGGAEAPCRCLIITTSCYSHHICNEFAINNDIVYNSVKTVCMSIIPKCLGDLHVPSLYLNKRLLMWVSTQKYLGVIFFNDRSDCKDIVRELCSLYARGNIILRKFKKCNIDIKKQLFKTYCSNMYCSPLWCNFTSVMLRKIKVAYNNIFRFLCNIKGKCSISQLFVEARVDSFDVIFRKSCFSLRRRILQSNNHLVSAICSSSHFIYDSLVAKQWAKSIFRLNLWSSVSVSFSAFTCQCVS